MLSAAAALTLQTPAFAPVAAPVSRSAVRSEVIMSAPVNRRELFATAAAAVAAASAVQGASAKAGQFGKQEVFGFAASSPFQPEGLDPNGTYGFKTVGTKLATGYEQDVTLEKSLFTKSTDVIGTLQPLVDSKTWWKVRDNLRTNAYNLRGTMKAMNAVASNPAAATAASKKVIAKVEALDLACRKKDSAIATAQYAALLDAIADYKKFI